MDGKDGNLNRNERGPHGGGDLMMGMMAMMMAICFGGILLFAVMPAVGFALGILIALGAGALMLVQHDRFMRHGGNLEVPCTCTKSEP
jgi:hypothetical protein